MGLANIEEMVENEIISKVKGMDLRPLVKDVISSMAPKKLEIQIKIGRVKKRVSTDQQHVQFDALLKYCAAGLNAYMVGPAGSGKTRAASEVAKVLDTKFYSESVCQQSSASLLKGYMDAQGKYVKTNFRRAFEGGGLFLLDEIDAGNPNVMTVLNAAVSVDPGEAVSFPDKMVKRSEKFICVAAANTFGVGADRQYVGRNPLDAASLDRFVFIEWGYDEILENSMANDHGVCAKWLNYVKRTRKAVDELKLRAVVSPRASIFGGKMLQAGFTYREAAKATIFKGMDADSIKKLEKMAPVPLDGDEKLEEDIPAVAYNVPPPGNPNEDRKELLLRAIRHNTTSRHSGAKGIYSLTLCIAKKDSGDYKAGAYYLNAFGDTDGDLHMCHAYGGKAGKVIGYANRSNFSRKFTICSESETHIWETMVSPQTVNQMAENLVQTLAKWKSENGS